MTTSDQKIEDTCEKCEQFRSLDDAIVTSSYGICKKSGLAVYKNDKKREECG